jgi:tRNA threonylcarbamoyl adenosine modification protein YjeE
MAQIARQRAVVGATPAPVVWELTLDSEAATAALGAFIAEELKPGDALALSGGLGAGKTALARAIVRALAGDPNLEVPSPTFTLLQSYETPRGLVVHADLYRIGAEEELRELGFDEARDTGILLIEWPERAPGLNGERLHISLDLVPGSAERRSAILTASGAFAARLARMKALRGLLTQTRWDDARRVPLAGDASTRAYERLVKPSGDAAILMISPPRPDGPPVRRGKPYSVIARLAESIHAFVGVDRGLRALGFSAPRILGEDLDAGLLLLEDLGSETFVDREGPIPERYGEATRLLARLHASSLPSQLPVTEGREHVLPPYDLAAMLIEVELLLDWYIPHVARSLLSGSARAEFLNLWTGLLQPLVTGPQTWTLRDYHSPNLIWLADREDVRRVGLLDFQDAVLGPPAYDVASLLQDARVTVPAELELRLLGLYARERKAADPAFGMSEFAGSYAVLAAQRATKILGIFARLDKRDGKPQYLAHLPRIEAYLARNLAHPALAGLRWWYETHLPRLCERS